MANEKRLTFKQSLDGFEDIGLREGVTVGDAICKLADLEENDTVEVVHGRWENFGGHIKMDLRCSVCNKRASNFVGGYEDWWDLWMPKYCPNCGAKMDGDGNA